VGTQEDHKSNSLTRKGYGQVRLCYPVIKKKSTTTSSKMSPRTFATLETRHSGNSYFIDRCDDKIRRLDNHVAQIKERHKDYSKDYTLIKEEFN